MSSLSYNNINLSINGVYIQAETLSVEQISPQKPILALNNNIPYDNTPEAFNGKISIGYNLQPSSEIIYTLLLSQISNSYSTYPSCFISIGDYLFTNVIVSFLTKFGLKLTPNGIVKTQAEFNIYNPITGILYSPGINNNNVYDTHNTSGIANYWSTQFFSGTAPVIDNKILQLEYSADISVTPIFNIGQPTPKQIYTNSIIETLNLLSEQQLTTNITGLTLNTLRPDLQFLVLSGINYSTPITINMSGFILKDSKYDVSLDNIILYNNTYTRTV